MNSMIKTAIASALTLAASSAFAALPSPSGGSSDLVLVVQNNATQATYVLDTGLSINTLVGTSFTTGAKATNNTLPGYTGTTPVSTTLANFLSANPASGDSWAIQAAQFTDATTQGSKPPGATVAVFTSSFGTSNPALVTSYTLPQLNLYANGTANSFQNGGALSALATASESGNAPAYAANDQQKYGKFGTSDMSAVGTPSELFAITGNGNPGVAQSYNLGMVVLNSDGSLSFTGNGGVTPPPPVPLPAAVWLFGSGLMGLVGVSRRRKAAAATATHS